MYQLLWRLGGPPETIWVIWRRASTGIQTPDRSVVITTTELGRPLSRHLHFVSYHHAGAVRCSNLVLASVNGLQKWPLLVWESYGTNRYTVLWLRIEFSRDMRGFLQRRWVSVCRSFEGTWFPLVQCQSPYHGPIYTVSQPWRLQSSVPTALWMVKLMDSWNETR